MDGALNPKTSLLIKIARALASVPTPVRSTVTLIDPEVAEWLDRMAELKFIRQEYMPETKPTETQ